MPSRSRPPLGQRHPFSPLRAAVVRPRVERQAAPGVEGIQRQRAQVGRAVVAPALACRCDRRTAPYLGVGLLALAPYCGTSARPKSEHAGEPMRP